MIYKNKSHLDLVSEFQLVHTYLKLKTLPIQHKFLTLNKYCIYLPNHISESKMYIKD